MIDNLNPEDDVLILCDLVEEYKAKVDTLTAELQRQISFTHQLQEDNKALADTISEKDGHISDLVDAVYRLEDENATYLADSVSLRSQLMNITNELKDNISDLSTAIPRDESAHQSMAIKLSNLQREHEKVVSQLATKLKTIEEYEIMLNQQQADIIDLSSKLRIYEAIAKDNSIIRDKFHASSNRLWKQTDIETANTLQSKKIKKSDENRMSDDSDTNSDNNLQEDDTSLTHKNTNDIISQKAKRISIDVLSYTGDSSGFTKFSKIEIDSDDDSPTHNDDKIVIRQSNSCGSINFSAASSKCDENRAVLSTKFPLPPLPPPSLLSGGRLTRINAPTKNDRDISFSSDFSKDSDARLLSNNASNQRMLKSEAKDNLDSIKLDKKASYDSKLRSTANASRHPSNKFERTFTDESLDDSLDNAKITVRLPSANQGGGVTTGMVFKGPRRSLSSSSSFSSSSSSIAKYLSESAPIDSDHRSSSMEFQSLSKHAAFIGKNPQRDIATASMATNDASGVVFVGSGRHAPGRAMLQLVGDSETTIHPQRLSNTSHHSQVPSIAAHESIDFDLNS